MLKKGTVFACAALCRADAASKHDRIYLTNKTVAMFSMPQKDACLAIVTESQTFFSSTFADCARGSSSLGMHSTTNDFSCAAKIDAHACAPTQTPPTPTPHAMPTGTAFDTQCLLVVAVVCAPSLLQNKSTRHISATHSILCVTCLHSTSPAFDAGVTFVWLAGPRTIPSFSSPYSSVCATALMQTISTVGASTESHAML
jgi:hypothetical protein